MWCRKTVAALSIKYRFKNSRISQCGFVLFCVNDSINQAELLHDKRYVSYTQLIPGAVYFGSTFMNPHPLDTREKDEALQDVFDPDFKLNKGPQSESQHECVKDKTAWENIWNATGGLDKPLSFVCVFCEWNVVLFKITDAQSLLDALVLIKVVTSLFSFFKGCMIYIATILLVMDNFISNTQSFLGKKYNDFL